MIPFCWKDQTTQMPANRETFSASESASFQFFAAAVLLSAKVVYLVSMLVDL